MHLRSSNGAHYCPHPESRLNGDVYIYMSPTGRSSDPPQTLEESSARPYPKFTNINRAPTTSTPACTWLERVRWLFDPALRDAEDMMLSLPYADIREKTGHSARVLDEAMSTGMGRAETRNLSGFKTSPKSKVSHTALPVASPPSQSGIRSLPCGGSLTNGLASNAFPRQHHDQSKIMTAM